MTADSPFAELVRRVRDGDGDAATELVRQYEPEIRRAIRVRLADSRLRRSLDSMDISQSVFANFFVRVVAGQFELEEPAQLIKLLATMARHKLLDRARQEQAARRDQRRVEGSGSNLLERIPDHGDTPSRIVADRDLLEAVHQQLTEEERQLAERRACGQDWIQIAAELGSSPEALRKKLTRAMDRVVEQLGIN